MPSKLEKAIKALAILTFFVPLILVSSKFIFPFIVPKILVFRGLTLLMLGCYILLLRLNWQKYRPRRAPINIAVGLFLFSFIVSTFVGVDWYKSFWDNHERMLGLFTILHFIIYYFVLTSVVKEWKDWQWLLRAFLLAGCAVMLIGLIQKFINPMFLLNRGSGRVSATLGNAIYFSGYGLFLMFVGLLLALKESIWLRSAWFWYAIAGALLGFLGVFWGGTRGTLLGLMIGGIVLLFVYLFTLKEKKLKFLAWGLVICLLVSLGLLFNFRHTSFVAKIPTVGKLFSSNLNESTTGTRLMAWGIAIDAWKEKPVFGWGPNNYYYAFNKYYNPKFLEYGWGETWFDNAHSAVFNTLAVQGIVGIMAYFLLFLVPAIFLIRWYLFGKVDKHVLAIGLAFLTGHFMHNATVFENPTSFLYFFFFLAFINSQSTDTQILQIHRSQITDKKFEDTKGTPVGVAILVVLVVIFFIYSTNINPARANTSALKSLQILYNNPTIGRQTFQNTLAIPTPHIDDIRSDYGRSVVQLATAWMKNGQIAGSEVRANLDLVEKELVQNRVLHPLDIRTHLLQAQVAIFLSQFGQFEKFMAQAENHLDAALLISPKRQQIQYMLSVVKLQLGKNDEAVSLLQDSIDSDPKIGEGWWRLAFVYKQTGDDKKAKEVIAMAQNKGVQFDAQGQSVISMILAADKTSK